MPDTRKHSRREFLRRGAVAGAAGLALPYFIPSGVLAAADQPGANDRIGIAGIGIGRQGTGVLRAAVGSKDCRFIGIADVFLPRAEEQCKRLGGEAYQDYRKLLERKDVDAIVTATPDHWRALVTIHACQAGKDVYAEKALSLTIREGRLMVEAARKYKRVFQVGSQQRSQAVNRLSCEYVRTGKLGKIKQVVGSQLSQPVGMRVARASRCPKGSTGTCGAARRRWCPTTRTCSLRGRIPAGCPSGRTPAAR